MTILFVGSRCYAHSAANSISCHVGQLINRTAKFKVSMMLLLKI